MELYFLRHAIAADPDSSKYRLDAERPLTGEGIEKMGRTARGFKKAGITFHRIVSSPYLRARHTAEITAKELDFDGKIAYADALKPEADFKNFSKLLQSFKDDEKVLLVGHQPSIGSFVSCLCAGRPDASIDFKKGALCRVDLYRTDPPAGALKWFMPPKFAQKID